MITAPNCLVKPLWKTVTAMLKLIYKQIENLNFKIQYQSGVKRFWPVQNNHAAINKIDKLNSKIRLFQINVCFLHSINEYSTSQNEISDERGNKVLFHWWE